MAFTKDDIYSINEAIASGELSVDFGDRKVTYRSIDDLRKAKEHIMQNLSDVVLDELGMNRKRTKRPRAFRVNVSKGIQ